MSRLFMVALGSCLVTLTPAIRCDAESSLMPPPGRYPVGFTAVVQYDYSRTYLDALDGEGHPTIGERARPIQISSWYPALDRPATPTMTYADYAAARALEEGPPDAGAEVIALGVEREARARGAPPAELRVRLAALSSHAHASAPPAPGRFPIVVYAPSLSAPSTENAGLCELLASRGYVVLAFPAMGTHERFQASTAEDAETEARDLEFVIAYAHTLSNVDLSKLGVMGFSFGGLADVAVAMRNSAVRAVVSLDGSIRYWSDLIKGQSFADPSNLRASLLYLAQGTRSVEEAQKQGTPPQLIPQMTSRAFALYEAARYSDITYVTLQKMSHRNFAPINTVLDPPDTREGWSPVPEIETSTAIAWRYVVAFLDAVLKDDASGQAFLARSPEENGAPPSWAVVSRKAALSPLPTIGAFCRDVVEHGGWVHAVERLHAIRAADPGFTVPPRSLSRIGHRMMEANRARDGLEAMRVNVELYPGSVSAYDNLGDAEVAVGDRPAAIAAYQRALSIDPTRTSSRKALERLGAPLAVDGGLATSR